MRKLIFLDPYISFGAHSYKHATIIPSECRLQGQEFIFYGDTATSDLADIVSYFEPYAVLMRGTLSEYVQKRTDEYVPLVKKHAGEVIISLTTREPDFEAWFSILADGDMQKHIIETNTRIVLQVGHKPHPDVIRSAERHKDMWQSLAGHVLVGFYSDFHTALVRDLYPWLPACTFVVPMYDAFYRECLPEDYNPQYVTYTGLYSIAKGPWAALEVIKENNRPPLYAHFFPLNKQNVLFESALSYYKQNSDVIDCRRLSKDEYLGLLKKTKVCLLPYDRYGYAGQASGILEECMLMGIPVLVPEGTWLSAMLKQYNGGGRAFSPECPGDIVKQLKILLASLETERETTLYARDRLYADRSFAIFRSAVDAMSKGQLPTQNMLQDTMRLKERVYRYHEFDVLRTKHEKAKVPPAALQKHTIGKDTDMRYPECAAYHMCFTEDKEFEQRIKNGDCSLGDTVRFVIAALEYRCDREMCVKLAQIVTADVLVCVPYDALCLLFPHISDSIKNNIVQILKERYDRNRPASDPEVLYCYAQVYFLFDLLEYADYYCQKAIALMRHGTNNNTKGLCVANCLLLRAEVAKKTNRDVQDIVEALLASLDEEIKPNDLYRIASSLKRLGYGGQASDIFERIVTDDIRLQGGIHFHLGEMFLQQNKHEEARHHLSECLSLMPAHNKAAEYLECIQ